MTNRTGKSDRQTNEVTLEVVINLDEQNPKFEVSLSTDTEEQDLPLAYAQHFIAQIARMGGWDGKIVGKGDFSHHLIEDVGICTGDAFKKAVGNKDGIDRVGDQRWPMEGSRAEVLLDLSGRCDALCNFEDVDDKKLFEMVKHFLKAFTEHAGIDLQCMVETKEGGLRNDHHKLETLGKAIGQALFKATKITRTGIPSTKGALQ